MECNRAESNELEPEWRCPDAAARASNLRQWYVCCLSKELVHYREGGISDCDCVREAELNAPPVAGLRLYCDHRNLLYVFATSSDIKKQIRGNFIEDNEAQRVRIRIQNIQGESNVWAEMILMRVDNHTANKVHLRTMTYRKGLQSVRVKSAKRRAARALIWQPSEQTTDALSETTHEVAG